jgi:hypothetical protein
MDKPVKKTSKPDVDCRDITLIVSALLSNASIYPKTNDQGIVDKAIQISRMIKDAAGK